MCQELTPRFPDFNAHSLFIILQHILLLKSPLEDISSRAVDVWSREEISLAGRIREEFPSRLNQICYLVIGGKEKSLAFGHLPVR